MRGAIPPLNQYVFMAWCLVKHRDNFTFTLHCSRVVKFCLVISLQNTRCSFTTISFRKIRILRYHHIVVALVVVDFVVFVTVVSRCELIDW
jgi:hypothetical protein